MRPLLVLSLVIVAVIALVFALFQFSSTDSRGDVRRGAPEETRQAEVAPQALEQAEVPRTLTADPTERELVAALDDAPSQRTVVAEGGGVYQNALSGTVLDPDGNPVAEARVTLRRQGVPTHLAPLQAMMGVVQEDLPERSTKTDEEGAYTIRSLEPAQDYLLVVEHEQFSRVELPNVALGLDGTTRKDVTLRRGLLLLGYVWDHANAKPLEGAELELIPTLIQNMPRLRELPPGSYERLTTTSAADGAYRFENVTPGKQFALTCRAPGFGTETEPKLDFSGPAGKPVVRDFRLRAAVTIAGRVVTPDRVGVVGAHLEALSFTQDKSSRGSAVSGPKGEFEIKDLLEGPTYMVMVAADGYSDARSNRVEAPTYDLVIELAPQGGLRGRVLSDETGRPLTGFQIALRTIVRDQGNVGRAIKNETFPNAPNGEFQLAGVEAGSYVIQGIAPGYAPTFSDPFDVVRGEVTPDVVVRMTRGGSITGLVVDAKTGDPVQGAKVTTHDNNFTDNQIFLFLGGLVPRTTTEATAVTGADGRFEIAMLTPEVYQVHIDHPNYKREILKDLRVENGPPTALSAIRLVTGASVRGTVYAEDGTVLEGATVTMRGTDPENSFVQYQQTTDAKGTFFINRVAGGNYAISATSSSDQMSGDPFRQIVEMKQSERQMLIVEGREYTQELYLGG